jgi:hypothetical protein
MQQYLLRRNFEQTSFRQIRTDQGHVVDGRRGERERALGRWSGSATGWLEQGAMERFAIKRIAERPVDGGPPSPTSLTTETCVVGSNWLPIFVAQHKSRRKHAGRSGPAPGLGDRSAGARGEVRQGGEAEAHAQSQPLRECNDCRRIVRPAALVGGLLGVQLSSAVVRVIHR